MRYVAMLRGINVGKHNRVTMAALKEAMHANGFSSVETYLQSGNALFDWKSANREEIDVAFAATFAQLGIVSAVILRSGEEMAKVVAADPFQSVDVPDKHKLVSFLKTPSEEELPRITAKSDAEIVLQRPYEIYSFMRVVDGPPDMTSLFKKVSKIPQTTRNWIVTQELARMLA